MTISTIKPDWKFITRHPAYFFAFGCGSGLIPWMPGTWGTLLAFPLYCALSWFGMTKMGILSVGALLFIIGVKMSDMVDNALGIHDHSGANFDEVVAMLLILALIPAQATTWVVAFMLFRFFDIVKPWPIRWLDQSVKGGWGVMLDDIAAALATIMVLYLIQWNGWI